MTIPTILIVAGIAIVIVALLARRGGPRVTTIEHRRVTRDEEDSDA